MLTGEEFRRIAPGLSVLDDAPLSTAQDWSLPDRKLTRRTGSPIVV
jgi:hypothetical protein